MTDNDNVLLTGSAQTHGRPEAWPLHLRRYWVGTIAEIEGAFSRATQHTGATVQRVADRLNLITSETYWEFSAADPTALVVELQPHLFELGDRPEARTFDYPFGLRTVGIEHNARSVRVRLAAGIKLKVYAKTTGRVRFEIEHDLQERTPARLGRHTSTDLTDLPNWLDALAEDAAEHLNEVLQYLEERTFFPAGSLPSYNLVRRVGDAAPDRIMAEAALSLLINNGVFRLGPRDPLRPTVQALVRSEVLLKRGRSAFVVAPNFRRAVAELRGERRRRAVADFRG